MTYAVYIRDRRISGVHEANKIAKLRRILRVHYKERAASEVFQQLATVCQQSNESPQQFLLRALDVRKKVNFAIKENECQNLTIAHL